MKIPKYLTGIFIFFLCLTINLTAESSLFISLGGNCHTAIGLKLGGLRAAAFPFDWIITTNHSNFIKVLDEDFAYFLDESCFVSLDGHSSLCNLYYGLDFPHDFNLPQFSGNREEEWRAFKEKYTRRIERFRAIRNYKEKVFFIRTFWSNDTENQNGEFKENTKRALEIRDALDRYFPKLDYTLVVWSHTDLTIPPLEPIDRVVEFRISKSNADLYHNLIELSRQ